MLLACQEALRSSDVGPGEIAKAIGETQQTVTNWRSRGVSQQGIVKLQRRLGVNPTFVTDGKGSILLNDPMELESGIRFSVPSVDTDDAPRFSAREIDYGLDLSSVFAWEHPDDLPPGEFVMVPRLDVSLSAGNGSEQVAVELQKSMPQAFRAEWIREQRLKPDKLAAMTATGDSMEPALHSGDSLLVDTSQTGVIDGKVYALWYDGGERVKRLFRIPGGGLRIVSDNAKHPSIELGPNSIEHIKILGRVVHRSGRGDL